MFQYENIGDTYNYFLTVADSCQQMPRRSSETGDWKFINPGQQSRDCQRKERLKRHVGFRAEHVKAASTLDPFQKPVI